MTYLPAQHLLRYLSLRICFCLSLFTTLLFSSCELGLVPVDRPLLSQDSGFYSGTITFENWPEDDSELLELVMVVYREVPSRSNFINLTTIADTVILLEQTRGSARFTFDRPMRVGTYPYAVVAQLIDFNLFDAEAWRPLAVVNPRFEGDSIGTPFTVVSNSRTVGLRVSVDFARSLPFPR